jgi:hypothetical protein
VYQDPVLGPLPPDVVFEFLGHLSAKDAMDSQTLRSAALVCSFCHLFCQNLLYKRIVLQRGAGEREAPSRRLLFKAQKGSQGRLQVGKS